MSGSQHVGLNETHLYDAVHNTRVFFLQNEAGFNKWTPNEEKIKKLKD